MPDLPYSLFLFASSETWLQSLSSFSFHHGCASWYRSVDNSRYYPIPFDDEPNITHPGTAISRSKPHSRRVGVAFPEYGLRTVSLLAKRLKSETPCLESRFPLPNPEFDRIFLCVDKGLNSFGQGTSNLIYSRLKNESSFSRENMIFKPEEFKSLLENMFLTSCKLFERALVKELVAEFDLKLESSFDIVGAICQARSSVSTGKELELIAR